MVAVHVCCTRLLHLSVTRMHPSHVSVSLVVRLPYGFAANLSHVNGQHTLHASLGRTRYLFRVSVHCTPPLLVCVRIRSTRPFNFFVLSVSFKRHFFHMAVIYLLSFIAGACFHVSAARIRYIRVSAGIVCLMSRVDFGLSPVDGQNHLASTRLLDVSVSRVRYIHASVAPGVRYTHPSVARRYRFIYSVSVCQLQAPFFSHGRCPRFAARVCSTCLLHAPVTHVCAFSLPVTPCRFLYDACILHTCQS